MNTCANNFPLFLFTLPLLLLSACRSVPDTVETAKSPFTAFMVDREIPLDKDDPAKNRMHISLTLLDAPEKETLNPLIRELLYEGMDTSQYAESLTASLENLYAEAGNARNGSRSRQESLDWEYLEVFEIQPADPAVLAISRNREYYLGGAHGMREKQYVVIAPGPSESGLLPDSALRVMIEDLVPAPERPKLLSLVEDTLRDYTRLEAGAPLSAGGFFEDSLEAADNFYPSTAGLVFHWNPSEIAAYVRGSFEVTVPWEKIVPLLSPRGASLLKK
jgi:hypothetical protein